jgi:dCMP deaminase
MAERSRCPTGAGCVIVDSQNRVVATGYAGPPAAYSQVDEEEAQFIGCAAYCRRRQVIEQHSAESHGFPQIELDYSDCPSSHAEMNAISFADRSRTEGGTFYISRSPCVACTKVIANSGVIRVVWKIDGQVGGSRNPGFAHQLFMDCSIKVVSLA